MKISTIVPDSPLRRQPPEVIARLERLKRHRVREHRWSDGVLLACPERDHAVPVFGVYDILFTCAGLMLIQLFSSLAGTRFEAASTSVPALRRKANCSERRS